MGRRGPHGENGSGGEEGLNYIGVRLCIWKLRPDEETGIERSHKRIGKSRKQHVWKGGKEGKVFARAKE